MGQTGVVRGVPGALRSTAGAPRRAAAHELPHVLLLPQQLLVDELLEVRVRLLRLGAVSPEGRASERRELLRVADCVVGLWRHPRYVVRCLRAGSAIVAHWLAPKSETALTVSPVWMS